MERDSRTLEPTAPRGDAAQALLKVQLLAGAMSVSALSVAFVTWLLFEVAEVTTAAEPSPLFGLLAVAAALALLAAPFVERRMLAPSAPSGPGAPAPDVERYQKAKTIGFGLRELAAMLGFVLAFLVGQPLWSYGLSAAALLAMALAWPRASDLPPRAGGRVPGTVEPG